MGNLSTIERDWKPLCTETLFQLPTEHPLICMEHKKTKERAYFDIKLDRLLSQQEAFDVLRGFSW